MVKFLPVVSNKMLREWYWIEGQSTRKIASKIGASQRFVIRLMHEFGIPRRDRIVAVIRGVTKYVKPPFSGDVCKKAYLLGFVLADFRRRRHGYQVDIGSGTTHPEFTRLFKQLFTGYAPIQERPYFNGSTGMFGWHLDAQLHPSFEFLLLPKQVSAWVSINSVVFKYFVAGYFDGEGTISIARNSDKCAAFIAAIASGDKSILIAINSWLLELGFHPSFRLARHAGDYNVFGGKKVFYRKSRWVLRLKRRAEVLRFIELLPLRHPEKLEKRKLMLSLRDKVYLDDVMPAWHCLRGKIEAGVNQYAHKAKLCLAARKGAESRRWLPAIQK